MRVLLLGNGFDLHYKLPTTYINFLHTVDFLVNNYTEEMRTVGDVLGNPVLQETDNAIKGCYEANKDYCDMAFLDKEEIECLIELAQGNMWYSYFLKAVSKDITWIDFEKQIGTVLSGVRDSFEIDPLVNTFNPSLNPILKHTIQQFNFYTDYLGQNTFSFKSEFLLEEPLGSKHYVLNTEGIVERLSDSLDELAVMLKIYLSQFAERVAKVLAEEDRLEDWFARLDADKVLSFNYTNTYECLFTGTRVEHIHGTTAGEIVLGINPDDDDKLQSIDTTFLPFKKYFQRVVRKTDLGYLALTHLLGEERGPYKHIALTVMGHSLDVTDKDVITEMFLLASQITVIYHNRQALSSYVNKLVQIYGKEEFDVLRMKKGLRFISGDEEIDRYLDSLRVQDELMAQAFQM